MRQISFLKTGKEMRHGLMIGFQENQHQVASWNRSWGLFGWLFGVSRSSSSTSSSSKSITVIITFDDDKSVIDFAYQSLEF
ncbi:MAG: hypothetical protein Ct9H90mP7_1390 [Candidatus Neomarinimicrobiota bacterium]|nr:MAG: hypothetical protein Ct9H90mP7_1390 [Candidatus Neomarinimicrobiota bacterium]